MITLDSLVDTHCSRWPGIEQLDAQLVEGPDAGDAAFEVMEAGFEMRADGHTFQAGCTECFPVAAR